MFMFFLDVDRQACLAMFRLEQNNLSRRIQEGTGVTQPSVRGSYVYVTDHLV
jgi:hypothetical protein